MSSAVWPAPVLVLALTTAAADAAPVFAACDAVADFCAKGDNRTDDTVAVATALTMCSTVTLRAGFTFLLRPLELPRRGCPRVQAVRLLLRLAREERRTQLGGG